ncbi:MAG: 5-methylcytosine-specific restriction enzyme [Methanolobus sp.]|jgi:MoxR-like ATPase|nr:5-methylcytosine-specific restriction enzyme [Methanolobus sp.]
MPEPQNRTIDQLNLGWWKINRVFTDHDVINMAKAIKAVDGHEYNEQNQKRFVQVSRPDIDESDDQRLNNHWSKLYVTVFKYLGIGTLESIDGVARFKKSIYADFLSRFPNKAYLYFQVLFLNYQLPHPYMRNDVKDRYKREGKETKPFVLLLKLLIELNDKNGIQQAYVTKGEILNYLQYQYFDLNNNDDLNDCSNEIMSKRQLTSNPYEVITGNQDIYRRFVKQLSYAQLFNFDDNQITVDELQIIRMKQFLKHYSICYTNPDSTDWDLNYFKIMTPEKYEIYKVKSIPKVDISHISDSIRFVSDDDSIVKSCITSLSMGKSIILYGPPGTGKTMLSTQLSNLFGCTSERVTASDDWSTYDTIGGLVHKGNEGFKGKDGSIVSAIENCYDSLQNGKNGNWLIIDEINRCKIDSALGEMFTCLESMDLNGHSDDEIERLWNQYFTLNLSFRDEDDFKKLPIPRTFRIIGTLNTYDKHFLHNISYALMRRFSYIYVPVLKNWEKELELIKKTLSSSLEEHFDSTYTATIENSYEHLFSKLKDFVWLLRGYSGNNPTSPSVNQDNVIREIGTAQLIDTMKICFYNIFLFGVSESNEQINALDESISANIIPQLEGLGPKLDNEFIEKIKTMGLNLSAERLMKMKSEDELF